MRDLIDIINSRCSIRHFELKPIPNDIIDKIIKAGVRAPTASAAEQWFFVVIEKETVRKKLFDLIIKAHIIYAEKVLRRVADEKKLAKWKEKIVRERRYYAPLYIAAYVDLREKVCKDEYSDFEYLWAVQSLSAAIENMILTAWSMGIGSVWLGVPMLMKDEFNEVLGIKDKNLDLMAILALGYPSKEPRIKGRKKDINKVTVFIK